MYVPSADGGMAQYAWELMHALSEHSPARYRFELVSSQDLQDQFKSSAYASHAILPVLRHRSQFKTPIGWVASRLTHYTHREWVFLRWLQNRPDIAGVHFQEWTSWLAASLIRRIRDMGKRVFHTVHNVVPHHYPLGVPKSIVNGWIRRSCRQCDGLFVHTDQLADQLTQFLGNDQPNPPIHVMPHGVWTVRDADLMPPLDKRLAWKRLLFFGSIRRNKGLHLLLRAMEGLPGYSITIAGEPHERQYYQNEIVPQIQKLRERGVQVEVHDRFVADEQVGPLFARHSAIILPYTPQFVAQSGVVFMALAYELPVVASEAGGLRDVFAGFRIGTTFQESTAQQLAQAIRSLYADQQPRDLLRQIRAAKEQFSWRRAAAATMNGYLQAIEARRHETQTAETHDCTIETIATL
jgi:glycosyltransferase involved in cell wall biosynthesis